MPVEIILIQQEKLHQTLSTFNRNNRQFNTCYDKIFSNNKTIRAKTIFKMGRKNTHNNNSRILPS